MSNRVQYIERQSNFLQDENMQLRKKVIQLQSRSMRDNLIIKGIPDSYDQEENTEEKVKHFIKTELNIDEEINFHVVHRLKPKEDKSPSGIVAKFEKRKDRNKVLTTAIANIKINQILLFMSNFQLKL